MADVAPTGDAGTNTIAPRGAPLSPSLQGKIQHGNHMATVKSMALLHELQDYMVQVEKSAAGAQEELEYLKREKRKLERELKASEGGKVQRTVFKDIDFQLSEGADLPPRVRAALEDNRMLKDQVRKLRGEVKAQEKQMASQSEQINKLKQQRDEARRLMEQAGVNKDKVAEEQDLAAKVANLESDNRNLQAKVNVLEKARAVDQRAQRQALRAAEAAKAEEAAARAEAEEALQEKDMEVRRLTLLVKDLERQLAPIRAREHECRRREREVAHLEELREEVTEKLRYMDEPRVYLMICAVEEEGALKDRSYKLADEMTQEEAATIIQAHYRGHSSRQLAAASKQDLGMVMVEAEPEPEPVVHETVALKVGGKKKGSRDK
ncbi:unnamed protein product [Pedinophyceae sp. YPF-701]|nr:unnamed protein product [Pedinophyceae sp. YPF-701]